MRIWRHRGLSSQTQDGATATADMPWPSASIGWAYVAVLSVANIISFIDRQILTLLVEPIKEDLGLSDTHIGIVHGATFALFYTTLGVVIAKLSDRYRRRNIVLTGIVAWSIATALCGLTRNFWQLFVARVGVAAGEATLAPATFSILSDCFPPDRRSGPFGVFSIGASAGAGISLLFGGLVVTAIGDLHLFGLRPWQVVFLVVACLGLIPFLALKLLPEVPRRGNPVSATQADGASFLRFTVGNIGTYAPIFLAYASVSAVVLGYGTWMPAYLMRNFDLSVGAVGVLLGPFLLAGGILGAVLGGFTTDRLERSSKRDRKADVLVVASVGVLPFGAAPFFAIPLSMALICAAAVFAVGTIAVGPVVAMLQQVTPGHFRARLSAVYLLTTNLVGLGLGAVVVALLTDHLFGNPKAVGQSLGLVSTLAAVSAIALSLLARRRYQAAVVVPDDTLAKALI